MQSLDDGLGRHADGANEELGALLDDDADELVEVAFGVVVVGLSRGRTQGRDQEINSEG